MAVDDLWYLKKKGADGKPLPSQRHGRGKRWRVRWVDPETGKDRQELFEKKADAVRADVNRQADISRGVYIDPAAGKISVGEIWEAWRSQQLHRDTTADLIERAGRLHILPLLGDVPLSRVRPSHLRTWVKDRSAPGILAPSSVHTVWSYVAAMFTWAMQDRLIGVNPCGGVALPEIPEKEQYIPTPDQVHALAARLPAWYQPAVYLAAGCGLRGGEIFGLEVGQVIFLQRMVKVRQQIKFLPGRGRYIGPPKTKTSRRDVELATVASESLAHHLKCYPARTLTIQDDTGTETVEREITPLFLTTNGTMVTRAAWSPVWRAAVDKVRKAQIEAEKKLDEPQRTPLIPVGFGLHGLRHYFATLLIHGGASVKTVQLALGHASPTITLNTYAHLWPDAVDRTRTLVDAALSLPIALEGEAK